MDASLDKSREGPVAGFTFNLVDTLDWAIAYFPVDSFPSR